MKTIKCYWFKAKWNICTHVGTKRMKTTWSPILWRCWGNVWYRRGKFVFGSVMIEKSILMFPYSVNYKLVTGTSELVQCCVSSYDHFLPQPGTRWSQSLRGQTTNCHQTKKQWRGSCRGVGSTTTWPTAKPRSSSARHVPSSAWRSSEPKWCKESSSSSRRWDSEDREGPGSVLFETHRRLFCMWMTSYTWKK